MSRVLVVEDEAHLATGLRFNIEAEGHSVEVSGDGETALERLLEKKEKFDAVVLDVMLPGKDGFSVVGALRKAQNYVPVLILTARGKPEDVLEGFAAGADDYLPKPFQLPIFLARLQGLLRRNQWLQKGNRDTRGRGGGSGDKDKVAAPTGTDDSAPEPEVFTFNGKTLDLTRWNCALTAP